MNAWNSTAKPPMLAENPSNNRRHVGASSLLTRGSAPSITRLIVLGRTSPPAPPTPVPDEPPPPLPATGPVPCILPPQPTVPRSEVAVTSATKTVLAATPWKLTTEDPDDSGAT